MARTVRLPFPVPRESGLDPVGHIQICTGIFASVCLLCGPGAISCSGLAGPDAGKPDVGKPHSAVSPTAGNRSSFEDFDIPLPDLWSQELISGCPTSFYNDSTLASPTSVLRYGLRQLLGLFRGALSWTRRPWRSRAIDWGSEKQEGKTLPVSTEGRETGGERERGMEEGGGVGRRSSA